MFGALPEIGFAAWAADSVKRLDERNSRFIRPRRDGSFIFDITGQFGYFSLPQTDFDNLRTNRFTASHIRTWRAFLWRAIKEEDLKDENGNYWQWSGDVSFMFPMLEMAGVKHYTYMRDINYVYNNFNPINEHKVDMRMVNDHASRIRAKPKYNLLDRK